MTLIVGKDPKYAPCTHPILGQVYSGSPYPAPPDGWREAPGPLFSASRASRRLQWPPEPSPAASLGDVTAARIFLRAFFDSGVTNEFIKLVHVGVLRCAEPVARRRRQSWAPKVRERCGWAASWGAAAVHGSHRLFQRLHACRP